MSKKKNLDSTMYSMFGVSNEQPAKEVAPEKVDEPEKAAAVVRPVMAASGQAGVTYLAPGSSMEGKLETDGDVEVAGNFKGDIIAKGKVVLHMVMQGNITAESLQLMGCKLVGNIVANGTVTLDEAASVTGNITAGELICSGNIKGDLDVKGNLALNEKSRIEGNIVTKTMTMSCGAVVAGGVKMGRTEK